MSTQHPGFRKPASTVVSSAVATLIAREHESDGWLKCQLLRPEKSDPQWIASGAFAGQGEHWFTPNETVFRLVGYGPTWLVAEMMAQEALAK